MDGPPPDPTLLEYLADDAGIGPEELRVYLLAEIARRTRLFPEPFPEASVEQKPQRGFQ